MLATDTKTPATALRDDLPGVISGPGEADFEQARYSFNLVRDERPVAIALPRTASEAAQAVRAIRDAGLRIAPQGSSHNPEPLGSLDDTVVVQLGRMRGVELDVEGRRARVEAGARWWDLTPQASEAGLAARHGSSPEINIVGYSLGGGVGWMARKHGLQANSVTAVEIVTADGELRVADADNDPELFWAVRGGGGNFGLVTAIEFGLVPVREFYAGALFFPFERSNEVFHAYREFTAELPEELTSVVRTLQMPDLELLPEIVRGKSFAIVEGIYLGSEADGAELIQPLRELGPEMDTLAMVPPIGLAMLHMDPIDPVPYASAHALLGELSERAIDEALAAVGPGAGSPVSVEVRHGGGALARSGPGHGAIATLPGEYNMFAIGPVMEPEALPALEADLARVAEAFRPDDVGRYLNFTEERHELDAMFPPGTLPRLRAVKAAYDPDGIFRANHAVDAA